MVLTMFDRDDIDRYLQYKAVNNITNSPNTTRSYRTRITQFLEFSNGATDPTTATLYRDRLSETRDTDQVKACLYILSDFFRFLDLPDNPFYDLSRVYRKSKNETSTKRIMRDERVLSDRDIERLLERIQNGCQGLSGIEYYLAYRNRFMIDMLVTFGMRIEGLVMMDLQHFDRNRRRATIYSSKNQVPYPIPTVNMLNDIMSYLNVRSRYMSGRCLDQNALLLSRTGRRLSDTSARRAVNRVFDKLGLYEPNRSTHQLRHYRATRNYRDGMAPQLIAQIMGMSEQTLRTTYLHLTDDDTVREYEGWLEDRFHEQRPVACPKCGYLEDRNDESVGNRAAGAPKLSIV